MTARLRELGYRVPDTQANFVWLDLGESAVDFAAQEIDSKIVIRPFADAGVRVTVTTPQENDAFLAFAERFAKTAG